MCVVVSRCRWERQEESLYIAAKHHTYPPPSSDDMRIITSTLGYFHHSTPPDGASYCVKVYVVKRKKGMVLKRETKKERNRTAT